MTDIKALMLRLLERQKEYVLEDLEVYACAMVVTVTAEETFLEFPRFQEEAEKIAAYAAIVQKAKLNHAIAIITVNGAFTRSNMSEDELDGLWWGALNSSNAHPCILVTASGPGMRSFAFELAYDIHDGEVDFGSVLELERTEVGMLPDWPGDLPTSPN